MADGGWASRAACGQRETPPPAPGGQRHAARGRDRAGDHRGLAKTAFWVMVGLTVTALAALGAEMTAADRTPAVAPGERAAAANAALVGRFYTEVWSGGRLGSVDEYVASDHRYHDPTASEVAAGSAGGVRVVAAHRRAFPDATIALEDVVAWGDRVAVRFIARGTHRGTVLGAAATGRAVAVTGVAVHRVADRRIVETWVTWDTFGLAEQVGLFLLPAPIDGRWDGAPTRERPDRPY